MVDVQDADLAKRSWHISSRYVIGYRPGAGRGTGNSDVLSRLVLERALGRPIASGMVADHINGDRLDNRRTNLREVTQAQNLCNRAPAIYFGGRLKSSRHKGVSAAKGGKWRAYIAAGGRKYVHLGTFDSESEAAAAYDRAAVASFGACARLNFPADRHDAAVAQLASLEDRHA